MKEIRSETIYIKSTPTEKRKFEQRADCLGMTTSNYGHDILFNGKERNKYARRKMAIALVNASKDVDCIYDLIERTDSEYIAKSELLPLVDTVKKGLDNIWKH